MDGGLRRLSLSMASIKGQFSGPNGAGTTPESPAAEDGEPDAALQRKRLTDRAKAEVRTRGQLVRAALDQFRHYL